MKINLSPKQFRIFRNAFLLLLMLGFCSTTVFAQSGKIISGVVLDQNGAPIVGADVFIPRTTIKTTTDKGGNFTLNLPADVTSIVVTYKGMRRETVNVSARNSFIIRMQPFTGTDANKSLDEEDDDAQPEKKKNNQNAASRVVTGVLLDEKETPLPGINVQVKSTKKIVTTNEAGKFIVEVPKGKQVLIFSGVSVVTKELELSANQVSVAIALQAKVNNLEEVLVVGYGTQKKINLTGSVSTLSAKDIQNVPSSSTINLLSGRLAGVSIVQPGGQPGADKGEVVIRGVGTTNDASPLVVIDGIISDLNTFNNMSPAELANVTVLKDAASAAIYGARGANGVILVTTKEPAKAKLNINLNVANTFQAPTYLPQFVNSWQWMTLHNEATGNNNFPQYAIDNLKNDIVTDTFANANHVDAVYQTAMMRKVDLLLSGGTPAASFQGNIGVIDQDGIMKGFSNRRYNYRGNIRVKTGNKADLGVNFSGYISDTKGPWATSATIINRINMMFPITPVQYSNGDYGVNYPGGVPGSLQPAVINQNPLLTTQIGRRNTELSNSSINSFYTYKPSRNLTLRTNLSYQKNVTIGEAFNPTYDYRGVNPLQTGMQNQVNSLQNNTTDNRQIQFTQTINYNKIFKTKHAINTVVGYEYVDYENRNFLASGDGLPNNDQQVLNNATTNIFVSGDKTAWRTQSFFGRINYAFDNKYLFEANLRVDGSSRFPTDKRYGYFPSFSAGWLVSQEKFFEPLKSSISLLKIRGSWGILGNDRIGNYPFQQVYSSRSYYPIAEQLNTGVSLNAFVNPNLKWEQTATSNIAFDLGLFKNKILITGEIFQRITSDVLYQRTLPSSFGIITPANLNIAKVSNKGWELNIEYRTAIANKVFINANANVSFVANKVLAIDGRDAIDGVYLLREGYALNSYYVLLNEGIYTDSSQFANYPVFNNTTNSKKIGAMKFIDANNDGSLTIDDRVPYKSSNTPYIFGANIQASYKGFDFSIQVQGVADKYIYIYDNANRPGNAGTTNFWKEWWDNRYNATSNPNGTWPILKRQSPEAAQPSTFWLRNASYVRIKNLEFGYTISEAKLKSLGMRGIRFYMQANNFFTISPLLKQLDPERETGRADNQGFPQLKSLTLGLNVNF